MIPFLSFLFFLNGSSSNKPREIVDNGSGNERERPMAQWVPQKQWGGLRRGKTVDCLLAGGRCQVNN
jgi:hypothetical protein